MGNDFISVLLTTVLTCFFLLASMSAALVHISLEKRRHRIINGFLIAALVSGLSFSMYFTMFPSQQKVPQVEDLSRIDVPSSVLTDDATNK